MNCTVKVIVNGQPTDVEATTTTMISTVIRTALELSNNTGRPQSDWEQLKKTDGTSIPSNKRVRDLKLAEDEVVYLSLKAGIGG